MKHVLLLGSLLALVVAGCSSKEVSSDELKAPFSDNKGQVESCYDKTLKKQPDLGSGTVELKFLINDEGKAYKTIFLKKKSTLSSKLLNACLKKVVHSWSFPSGKAIEVIYPFQFEKATASLSSESQGPKASHTADEPKKQTELDVIDTSPEESSGDEETPAE